MGHGQPEETFINTSNVFGTCLAPVFTTTVFKNIMWTDRELKAEKSFRIGRPIGHLTVDSVRPIRMFIDLVISNDTMMLININ